jgi:S-adenosylhomocysteine hydrolase
MPSASKSPAAWPFDEREEDAMTDLKGKVALVTGSARGIGKAIAERYGSCGASVVVNYAGDRERANATVEGIQFDRICL